MWKFSLHTAQASAALCAARKIRLRLRHAFPFVVTPVGPFDAKHRLTSPTAVAAPSLRFRPDPSEVSPLSGWVFPALAGPICPVTRQHSLSPPSSTPSVIPLPCGRDTASRRDEWGLPCCPMWRRGWGGCVL